jgi:hypothetical protein
VITTLTTTQQSSEFDGLEETNPDVLALMHTRESLLDTAQDGLHRSSKDDTRQR